MTQQYTAIVLQLAISLREAIYSFIILQAAIPTLVWDSSGHWETRP